MREVRRSIVSPQLFVLVYSFAEWSLLARLWGTKGSICQLLHSKFDSVYLSLSCHMSSRKQGQDKSKQNLCIHSFGFISDSGSRFRHFQSPIPGWFGDSGSDLGFASMIITRIFRSGILCNLFEFERSNTDCKNHWLLVNLRSFKSTVCNSSLSVSQRHHKRWHDSVPSLNFQTCYHAVNLSPYSLLWDTNLDNDFSILAFTTGGHTCYSD